MILPRDRSLPRGIPAASLKRTAWLTDREILMGSSAGNTRGLIEARTHGLTPLRRCTSSAGNTRGLIEAIAGISCSPARSLSLPRGIPAASLKPRVRDPPAVVLHVFRGEYPRPH